MDGMVSFHLTRLWNNSFINKILLLIHLLTLAFRTGAEIRKAAGVASAAAATPLSSRIQHASKEVTFVKVVQMEEYQYYHP